MILEIIILLITLGFIVFASELFTNGVEWLGQRLQLSEGVVGSVFAAVGTALPETLIPIVALLFFGKERGAEVGIGAIAGAPFMLSTLTLGLCGIAFIAYKKSGRRAGGMVINEVVIKRDLMFFILAYAIAIITSFFAHEQMVRWVMAVILVLVYPLYLFVCFKHVGEVGEEPEKLYFDRILKVGSTRLRAILPQIFFGLAGITGGAYMFVKCIQDLSDDFHIPALVLSLIVCPVATEMPEKINSLLWIRNNKDTLALGNVTGALVFQSCFPVAFGVAFTSWQLDQGTLLSGFVALTMATAYLVLLATKKLRPWHLATGAMAYIVTIGAILFLDLPHSH